MLVHCIADKQSIIIHCGDFLLESSLPRWLTNFKYNNIVPAESLTITDHGLGMRILFRSLQCAPETERCIVFPKLHLNCTVAEIYRSQSYYK